jgi:hypothetical protein
MSGQAEYPCYAATRGATGGWCSLQATPASPLESGDTIGIFTASVKMLKRCSAAVFPPECVNCPNACQSALSESVEFFHHRSMFRERKLVYRCDLISKPRSRLVNNDRMLAIDIWNGSPDLNH